MAADFRRPLHLSPAVCYHRPIPEKMAAIDDALLARLPLPLAQLYRRAHNAKTPLERHLTAFYFWEAGLKLLASTAIAIYRASGSSDPTIDERLKNLTRPSLGHWWEFARRIVPHLAQAGDCDFAI